MSYGLNFPIWCFFLLWSCSAFLLEDLHITIIALVHISSTIQKTKVHFDTFSWSIVLLNLGGQMFRCHGSKRFMSGNGMHQVLHCCSYNPFHGLINRCYAFPLHCSTFYVENALQYLHISCTLCGCHLLKLVLFLSRSCLALHPLAACTWCTFQ